MLFWLYTVSVSMALDCEGSFGVRVVGYDPSGEIALVRHEHKSEETVFDLALGLIALDTGEEIKRWSILRPEDRGDATLRGQRWRRAEAELRSSGIRIDPSIESLSFSGHPPAPVDAAGASLRFSHPALDGADPQDPKKLLQVTVVHGEHASPPATLASWMWYSSFQFAHMVSGIFLAPGGQHALISTSRDCEASRLHVVSLRPAPVP